MAKGRVPVARARPLKISTNKPRSKNCRSRTVPFSFERRPTKNPDAFQRRGKVTSGLRSPQSLVTLGDRSGQAACFHFLHHPIRPNAPKIPRHWASTPASFRQQMCEGLFPLFGCGGGAFKKDGRALYRHSLTRTVNLPSPRLCWTSSSLHDN